MASKFYHQGKYTPMFPDKYKGDPNNIVFRSGLELKYFREFDMNPNILEWASEEFYIPYYDPLKNKVRKYFIDLYIKMKDTNGEIQKYLIEIKPYNETVLPKKGSNLNTFKKRAETYVINQAKWEATKLFCEKHDLKFQILTEKNI